MAAKPPAQAHLQTTSDDKPTGEGRLARLARVYAVGGLPRRLGYAFAETGALWLYGTAALLGVSLFGAWLRIPLIGTWKSWTLPIDIGWGVRSDVISYGALTALLALYFCWRGARATDWTALAPLGVRRVQPLPYRRLFRLGALACLPTALFVFQVLFVDFGLAETLANDENQSLLITKHLGYSIPPQHFSMIAFQFSVTGISDRLYLLFQVGEIGALAPVLAMFVCVAGPLIWRVAQRVQAEGRADASQAASSSAPTALSGATARQEQDESERESEKEREERLRAQRIKRWLIIGSVALGLIVFGRAPVGLFVKSQGLAALNQGQYQTALSDFALAETLNPSLDALPHFHVERGQALYLLGQRDTLDAGMFLAGQYDAIGIHDQAWQVERELLRSYPTSGALKQATEQTLEFLAEANTKVAFTPTDNEEQALNPQVVVEVAQVDGALPWLDRLLMVQPDSIYALYMHGRVLYNARSYEAAGSDFLELIYESHDSNMQSSAYTYLALCYGGLGNITTERFYLRIAVELDHDYYNTTARESASGLH